MFIFSYLIERGVCFLTVCEATFSKRQAFAYLEDLQQEFHLQFGSKVDTVARPYSFIEFGKYDFGHTLRFNPKALRNSCGIVKFVEYLPVRHVQYHCKLLRSYVKIRICKKQRSRTWIREREETSVTLIRNYKMYRESWFKISMTFYSEAKLYLVRMQLLHGVNRNAKVVFSVICVLAASSHHI